MQRAGGDSSASDITRAGSGGTVAINGLLQLYPPHLEAEVWQSPAAVRLLRSLDYFCLTKSIIFSVIIIRAFSSNWAWYQSAQAVLYLVVSMVQLLTMHLKGDLYHRYRFKVTLINRLLRLITVIQNSLGSPTPNKKFSQMAAAPQAASSLSVFIRCIIAVPMFWWNHSSYVLPFPYVLAAQLITFAAVCNESRLWVCLMYVWPGSHMQLSQRLCPYIKLGMHYLGMLLAKPPSEAAELVAAECQGLQGLVLLSLYANTVVLLLVPCLFVYFVELNLKIAFIKQRRLVLQHAPPCPETLLAKAVVVYAAVVGGYMACEGLLFMMSPLKCNSASMLVTA